MCDGFVYNCLDVGARKLDMKLDEIRLCSSSLKLRRLMKHVTQLGAECRARRQHVRFVFRLVRRCRGIASIQYASLQMKHSYTLTTFNYRLFLLNIFEH